MVAMVSDGVVNDIGIILTIALILLKSWRDNHNNNTLKDRIEEVHDQVKSPNGTTTAESVEALKRNMSSIDHKFQDLTSDVSDLKKDVSDLAIYVGQKQRSSGSTRRRNPPRT